MRSFYRVRNSAAVVDEDSGLNSGARREFCRLWVVPTNLGVSVVQTANYCLHLAFKVSLVVGARLGEWLMITDFPMAASEQ